MSHLLAISVGPVQEFIAAARRTRDLWFGSYLLSEISKATAKALLDGRAELIFPAPKTPADLEPDLPDQPSPSNVANIILARIENDNLQAVVETAKAAAKSRWRYFADIAFREHQATICSEIWKDQVDDVIEIYAAWVTETGSYEKDRQSLMRLLAGRKNCRDFERAKGRAGIPKSSLDGLRESVLKQPHHPSETETFRKTWPLKVQQSLRLNPGEQLDVLGVVKRTGGSPDRYPPTDRIAVDPWLRGLKACSEQTYKEVLNACRSLGLPKLDVDSRRGYSRYQDFPYEGTPLYMSRHRALQDDAEYRETPLAELRNSLATAYKDYGEPSPYLAVLVADGDSMGKALSRLESADEHRQFSQSLAGFAAGAKKVVHDHSGILVYAGGDDVLGFVPVDKALSCARKLHDDFGSTMKEWATKTGTELTLSVGVAIAHFMEPLEDLLNYGREAEKHAKEPKREDKGQSSRNGLTIHLLKRGGGPITVRANWKNEGLDHHLAQLGEWINSKSISGRVAYDLRQIAELYIKWPENLVGSAIQRDTLSILKGKQPHGDDSRMEDVIHFVRKGVVDSTSLELLSKELLIARQLAVSLRQASVKNREEAVLR